MDRAVSDPAVIPGVLLAFGVAANRVEPLSGGLSTAAWRVDDSTTRWVLRRHDPGKGSFSSLASELVWLAALGDAADPIAPAPVRRVDGALFPVVEAGPEGEPDGFWTLLTWVEGETLGRLPDAAEAGMIGDLLAALHRQAQGWTPPPAFARPTYADAHFVAAKRQLVAHVGAGLDDRARQAIDAGLVVAVAALEGLGREPDEFGLIHTDLHDGNTVFGGKPRRAAAIDFERCGWGWWALDLAMAMHYLPTDLWPPLLNAYAAGFPLSDRGRDALPALRFLAGIDNLAVLSAFPEEAGYAAADLPGVIAQAEELAGRL